MTEKLLKNIYFCLICILIIILAYVLHLMGSILVPLVFAIIAYVTSIPLMKKIETKFKVPRLVSALSVFFGFALICTVLIAFVSNSVSDFYQSADVYKDKVLIWIDALEQGLIRHGITQSQLNLKDQILKLPIFDTIKTVTGTVTNFFSSFLLVIVFSFFLILGSKGESSKNELMILVEEKISKYLGVKLMTSILTGFFVGLILGVSQIELAFMFGLINFLLNFIPNIGGILGTLLPLPLVLLHYGFGWEFALILSLMVVAQFILGNIVETKLLGDSMELHPVAILVFLIFWGQIWGIAGMFLAVPITAILKIILSRIEETKSLANILAGKLSD